MNPSKILQSRKIMMNNPALPFGGTSSYGTELRTESDNNVTI